LEAGQKTEDESDKIGIDTFGKTLRKVMLQQY
jgi:hypothetical protein